MVVCESLWAATFFLLVERGEHEYLINMQLKYEGGKKRKYGLEALFLFIRTFGDLNVLCIIAKWGLVAAQSQISYL